MRLPHTRILYASLLALFLSLTLARVHPFGDAGLFAAPRSQPPQLPASIPPAARAILAASCADCHSTPARAPCYGHFAPISWLLERDILDARSHLNLSQWDHNSPDQQQVLLAEIAQQVRAGHMPPPQYLLIHRNARLTPAEISTLLAWAHSTSAAQPLPPDPARDAQLAEGNSENGKDLFNRRCTGCHSLTDNHEGPRLGNVYGRPSASVPGFPYSAALIAAHITWNEQTLDRWLTDPDAFLPGNNMDFLVTRPQERADIIAFLKASSSH